MLNPNPNDIILSEQEYLLYAKHLILNNVGINGQKRLKKAKILMIGAGGLGCPAMLYLASSGIGYIGIIDYDSIDISNLNRQILYNFNDLEKQKLISAKKKLKYINPYCKIILHSYKLNYINSLEIFQYYDIIIDGTDNFQTRKIIDISCYKLHKIHIYGAVQQFDTQISVFNYKSNLRYSSLYINNINILNNECDYYGIMGIVTGYTGILQATEVIKIILGIGKTISNQLMISNLLNKSLKNIKIYLPKIQIHKKILCNKSKIFISKSQIYNLNKYIKNKMIFIDIRQSNETSNNYIKYSIHIPLNKFKKLNTINFIKNYNYNKIFIIYCNTTYRSIILSNIFNKYHINYYILKI
uniref:Molybdopterin biosynthesis protein n=1 Tax=Apoglossum ruscifolium TaxID=167976 RepID=A0A4D6WN20_9FLOR|nr:Molybdopterin biosynthesis protein [Apoglossum ruscifolium]